MGEFFGDKVACTQLNPEEAIAHGAAVQAATVTGCGPQRSRTSSSWT